MPITNVPQRVLSLLAGRQRDEWVDTQGVLHGPSLDHDITAPAPMDPAPVSLPAALADVARLDAEAAADHEEQDGLPAGMATVALFWTLAGLAGAAATLIVRCAP